tara:strand:+ start:8241 stop:8981 length:741 start_codon:yes stop_codon:yes gene_type:complete
MGGLLDHSTNTIILDAVLTTAGRAALARFNGSFQITKFALTDDEIQYNLVRQYGRVIGKEYIEKLTPIMEANTNLGISCKFHLKGASSQHHVSLPNIKGTGANYNQVSKELSFDTTRGGVLQDIELSQDNPSGGAIAPDLRDSIFIVRMRADQFQLQGAHSPTVDEMGVAEYRIGSSGVTTDGGGKIALQIGLSPQLQDTNRYKGTSSIGKAMNIATSETQARGVIKVMGLTSGETMTINAKVSKV